MRKVLSVRLIFVAMLYCLPSTAQQAQIVIDKIVQDNSISGHVTGLDAASAPHYRVVVYVHTDVWYIHPYAGQGKGMSWAGIGPSGTWSIRTVKREFPADQVAALVVNDTLSVPPRTDSIDGIPHVALFKLDLSGTPDYGKL